MISWDGRTRKVVLDGQPVDTARIVQSGDGWIATIAAARGVDLTLTASQPAGEGVFVDLWRRPAEDEVGVAVVADRGKPAGLAVIPVCECGEQGCANAGRQINDFVDAEGTLELIDLVSRLPLLGQLQPNQEVWRPDPAHDERP
ncbi:MAG: hypothetical protein M9942_10160 [Microthrixaceae bacterium]|nr:hypothetical protein [Microthrixaceae bacterium]